MDIFTNTAETRAAVLAALHDVPDTSTDAARPQTLLARCPVAAQTPLVASPALAAAAGVAQVNIKDERGRMGLGSFKALGAAYVIASDAEKGVAQGRTYVTASAGNHGLSVAAGAQAFGANAVVFLADTVPETFADRLRAIGAQVERHGAIYEDSMAGAMQAADDNGWTLLSDSSWPGYFDRPHLLMEGYLALMAETVNQIDQAPTHIFLQAGVGGLAAASAAYARKAWGDAPRIIVVEPDVAPALHASIIAGSAQVTTGPSSDMGRLDCKEPSLIALKSLARDATDFMLISEAEGAGGAIAAQAAGLTSTPSGAAGLAGLLAAQAGSANLDLDETSRVLVILSEEASD
ncbi:pyridoxal-phosphate dependent enzyme [Yoonia sp. 208BN28-4]|uniref:pyridoxal-phosphate dependent enzyme n=1 Tax=Yoonia sp. 208BN28-4 TaxID=3126505 RepID=UPI0030AB0ADE